MLFASVGKQFCQDALIELFQFSHLLELNELKANLPLQRAALERWCPNHPDFRAVNDGG